MRKELLNSLKKKIDIRTYKESIKRLDFMFDVLSIRKNIFGDENEYDGNFKISRCFRKDKKMKDINIIDEFYIPLTKSRKCAD